MAKKIKNARCPLNGECGRSCLWVNDELGCDYYKNNAVGDRVIPDQEELRKRLEEMRERLAFEAEVEALELPEDEGEGGEKRLVYLPVSELHPHPSNPRLELGDLSELAESIRARGVMQNLTVVPREGGGYLILIGHRRHAAAALVGLSVLPCVVVDLSPKEQLGVMLLENIQRSDLTAYEQARGFQMMIDLGESVASVSDKTGFSESTVRRRLKMAELDEEAMKEVSGRQLSFEDFDKLSGIKDLEKRNEVLLKIGTNNFESAVNAAIREEEIAERMPFFLEKVKALGAKEFKNSADRYSNEYERIFDVCVTDKGAEDKVVVPKKHQGKELFYCVLGYRGEIELWYKRPKEKQKKRPKAEIEREKRIDECKKGLKAAEKAARELRAGFVRGLVMHSKNKEAVLAGAVQAMVAGVLSYQYEPSPTEVLEFIGKARSENFNENKKMLVALLEEESQFVYPALVYLFFENKGHASYVKEVYNDFPKHETCERLDLLYAWLCSLGYEMSDEEKALQDGTHELFAEGEKK